MRLEEQSSSTGGTQMSLEKNLWAAIRNASTGWLEEPVALGKQGLCGVGYPFKELLILRLQL